MVDGLWSDLPDSEDVFPFLSNKPLKPEIKVSSLENSFFYLHDGKIFYDKHLPDLVPTFLSRIKPHPRFSPSYFTALYSLVSAPGNTYPTGTYNFKGARIPLVHTNLNIPKWRELLAEYPKNDIVDKLEFGFFEKDNQKSSIFGS